MTTKTILSDDDQLDYWRITNGDPRAFARAIEQAVLNSPEIQQAMKDAERYQWLREQMIAVDFEYGNPKCIALVFKMPDRDMVFSADCDANVDLAME